MGPLLDHSNCWVRSEAYELFWDQVALANVYVSGELTVDMIALFTNSTRPELSSLVTF
jgi:hypothetical protein